MKYFHIFNLNVDRQLSIEIVLYQKSIDKTLLKAIKKITTVRINMRYSMFQILNDNHVMIFLKIDLEAIRMSAQGMVMTVQMMTMVV